MLYKTYNHGQHHRIIRIHRHQHLPYPKRRINEAIILIIIHNKLFNFFLSLTYLSIYFNDVSVYTCACVCVLSINTWQIVMSVYLSVILIRKTNLWRNILSIPYRYSLVNTFFLVIFYLIILGVL